MTSHQSTLAERSAPPAIERDEPSDDRTDDLTPDDRTPVSGGSERRLEPDRLAGASLNGSIVEELANRLPTSELVNIIKGALECGRRNLPFTESDLLRAMTFGSTLRPAPQAPRGTRLPRG
jgi:hypothetical protein